MRKVAILTRAYAGCRHKIGAMCEQLYGKDCIDIYRSFDMPSDVEALHGKGVDHVYQDPKDCVAQIAKHEIIHAFCDNCEMLLPLLATGRKFIVHQHDIASMRGLTDFAEAAVHLSPNTRSVFTSPQHQKYICQKYGIPELDTAILYNLPVMEWQPELCKVEKVDPRGVVYFGHVSTSLGYRFYRDIWKVLLDAHFNVYVYLTEESVRKDFFDFYKGPGFENLFLRKRVAHTNIYQEIAKYGVGFVGYAKPHGDETVASQYATKCVPNKAFDYMFAGIPTISYNLGESEKFVSQWGRCTDNVEELPILAKEALAMDIDYGGFRKQYCMETQKDQLKSLHDEVR